MGQLPEFAKTEELAVPMLEAKCMPELVEIVKECHHDICESAHNGSGGQ